MSLRMQHRAATFAASCRFLLPVASPFAPFPSLLRIDRWPRWPRWLGPIRRRIFRRPLPLRSLHARLVDEGCPKRWAGGRTSTISRSTSSSERCLDNCRSFRVQPRCLYFDRYFSRWYLYQRLIFWYQVTSNRWRIISKTPCCYLYVERYGLYF